LIPVIKQMVLEMEKKKAAESGDGKSCEYCGSTEKLSTMCLECEQEMQ